MKPQQEQITAIFQKVAVLLFDFAKVQVRRKPWKKAYIDKRFSNDNSGIALSKCRIELATGKFIEDIHPPRGSASLCREAFELRSTLPEKHWWYGVMITVYPDGRSEVAFDYDRDCLSGMTLDS